MVTSSKTRTNHPFKLAQTPIRIVERDIATAATTLIVPQADAQQLQRAHFPDLKNSVGQFAASAPTHRLGLLATHGWLNRRRIPYPGGAGAAPYCFTCGLQAAPYVADRLSLPEDVVRRRIANDARLSFVTYPHRKLTADTYVAFATGAQREGFSPTWQSDRDVAERAESVTLNGKPRRILPDGFVALGNLPHGGSTAFFLEIQVASDPSKWLKKCLWYAHYYRSGQYQKAFGYKAFRILGITTSQQRAKNLRDVIVTSPELRQLGAQGWCWTSWREAVVNDVWGAIWLVGDEQGEQQYRLL